MQTVGCVRFSVRSCRYRVEDVYDKRRLGRCNNWTYGLVLGGDKGNVAGGG